MTTARIIALIGLLAFATQVCPAQETPAKTDGRLPAALADHTLRDTGIRRRLILTTQDGRQIVVEIPVLAYIPNFEHIDFMTLVRDAASANPATSEVLNSPPPREGAAVVAPTVAGPAVSKSPSADAAQTRAVLTEEIKDISRSLAKLEKFVTGDNAVQDLQSLTFRLNAVSRQLEETR